MTIGGYMKKILILFIKEVLWKILDLIEKIICYNNSENDYQGSIGFEIKKMY
jgi:hypothetical protein